MLRERESVGEREREVESPTVERTLHEIKPKGRDRLRAWSWDNFKKRKQVKRRGTWTRLDEPGLIEAKDLKKISFKLQWRNEGGVNMTTNCSPDLIPPPTVQVDEGLPFSLLPSYTTPTHLSDLGRRWKGQIHLLGRNSVRHVKMTRPNPRR